MSNLTWNELQDKLRAEHNARVGFKEYLMTGEIAAALADDPVPALVEKYKREHPTITDPASDACEQGPAAAKETL